MSTAHSFTRGNSALAVCYTTLASLAFLNLNAVLAILYGQNQAFSIVYFLALLPLLVMTWPQSLVFSNFAWWLYTIGILAHLTIGFLSAGANNSAQDEYIYQELISVASGYFITLAVASVFASASDSLFAYLYRTTLILLSISTAATIISYFVPAWHAIIPKMDASGRACGFFGNPGEAGLQACALIPIAGAYALWRRHWGFAAAAICGAVIAVCLSFSRGSMFLVALLVVLFVQVLLRRNVLLGVGIAIGLIIAFNAGYVFLQNYTIQGSMSADRERRVALISQMLVDGAVNTGTTGSRLDLASEGTEFWLKAPILGHGLASTRSLPVSGKPPHNTFIRLLAESGVLSGIAVGLAFILFFRNGVLLNATGQMLVVGIFCVQVIGYSISNNMLDDRNHNILFGLMVGCICRFASRLPRGFYKPCPATA